MACLRHNSHSLLLVLLIAVVLLVQGCQTARPLPSLLPPDTSVQSCREFLSLVDENVMAAKTSDTSVFRVASFPYLRTNRFLAQFSEGELNPAAAQQWLEHMHYLDLQARQKEILNLEHDQYRQLSKQTHLALDRSSFIKAVEKCSRRLFAHEITNDDLPQVVRETIDIPGEYQLWRRVIGLYPLVALPVGLVSANVFDDFRAWHATPPEELPTTGQPVIYRPVLSSPKDRLDPEALYRSIPNDALRIPILTNRAERQLVSALAPIIVQDTAATYDRIGKVVWKEGTVGVDPSDPSAYYYLSYGQIQQRVSLQINYVFWYSHRAGENAPWFERGQMDGLTIRISLDHSGRPAILDVMNNCGCYHFFVPDQKRIRKVRSQGLELAPLVPAWMPESFPERRLTLKVNSGWHQVQHLLPESEEGSAVHYRLRPYRELEMLPDDSGQHRSIFNPEGILWGTERIEPLLFFSMGIPDIGSMRQRGHHAIKLIGRAHFDDPLLFDKTFEYR